MKKVLFRVTNLKNHSKVTGYGYITTEDLVTAQVSKNGNAYIRVYDDAVKHCHPVFNKDGEFKGEISEFHTIEVPDKYGALDTREIEVDYEIWFKIVD